MAMPLETASIRDAFTECPICTEHFDENTRIPRRMPCCVQSICEACLEIYSRGCRIITCPMCRQLNTIPHGVKSLPKERLILRILDHLKIQQGACLPCTECPDGNQAMAYCNSCGLYLCNECLQAHIRNALSKKHKTMHLEEMKGQPVERFRCLHQCIEHEQQQQFYCYTCDKVICVSCTVVNHKEGNGHEVAAIEEAHRVQAAVSEDMLNELDEKSKDVHGIVKNLKRRNNRVQMSKKASVDAINKSFDKVIEAFQQRRKHLLADYEDKFDKQHKEVEKALEVNSALLKRMTTTADYTRRLRGKGDKVEDLELICSSNTTIKDLLKAVPENVEELSRSGVCFTPLNISTLTALASNIGLVRLVTFEPREGMDHPEVLTNYAVIIKSPELTKGDPLSTKEYVFHCQPEDSDGQGNCMTVTCPSLEFDPATAHDEITFLSSTLVNNSHPSPVPADADCRMQVWRRVLTAKPLVIQDAQKIMFQVDLYFTLKTKGPDSLIVFECALTESPVDIGGKQPQGLNVTVQACSTHKQLCLITEFNGEQTADVPITKIRNGISRNMKLCFLLDSCNNVIHVLDADSINVVCSARKVVFQRPLWAVMYVGLSRKSELRCQLVSGRHLSLAEDMKALVASVL